MTLASLFEPAVYQSLARQLEALQNLLADFMHLFSSQARGNPLLAGTFPHRHTDGSYTNRAWLFRPDGSHDFQDKLQEPLPFTPRSITATPTTAFWCKVNPTKHNGFMPILMWNPSAGCGIAVRFSITATGRNNSAVYPAQNDIFSSRKPAFLSIVIGQQNTKKRLE